MPSPKDKKTNKGQHPFDSAAHFAPFLDAIINTTGIGLWDWNLATGEVIYSPQWEIIAGYEPGTLAHDVAVWENALFSEDLPEVEAAIQHHLDGLAPLYEAEFRMHRPDGSFIWAQDKGVVTQWDTEGKPLRLIGVLQDITRLKKVERALKEQTEQLDFVSRLSGLGRWEWDIAGNHIHYDSFYLEMLGYAADEVDGSLEEWEAFLHPDDRATVNAALDAYLAGEVEQYQIETRMRHKDGHYVWTLDLGRIVSWDADGNPTRLLGGHLDIDRLKQVELQLQAALADNEKDNVRLQDEMDKAIQNLQETRQFNKAMFDANPYINIIFNDQLELMDCNPAAVTYFGFDTKESLLENLLPLLNGSIPAFQPDGSPSTPLSKRFAYVKVHGFIEFEVEMVLGGKRIPMRFTLKKIAHKDSFAIAGYLVDMLSLREARNELLRQDSLLRQVNRAATNLMSVGPDAFDSTIAKVLRSLGRSVGASRMYIWEYYMQDGRQLARERYLWDGEVAAPASSESAIIDFGLAPELLNRLKIKKIINQEASELPESIRTILLPRNTKAVLLVPVIIEGAFWGFIGLDKSADSNRFTGIEEKVIQSGGMMCVSAILRNEINTNLIEAREAAMASDRAKSEFLSRMSHEIRTPINAIIGMTAIARKTDDWARVQYSLDKVEIASNQLLEIINDILDMSKIESGRFEISPVSFDLEKALQNAYNVVQVRIEEKHQHFCFDFDQLFTHEIICDELRLSQVIINLLTNAVKFTPEGGALKLTAGYTAKEDGLYTLHIAVSDTGIGLSPAQASKLFRSFEQADGSISRRYGGTGLGLAISKRITNLMGGDIRVESVEGEGSTFMFTVDYRLGEPLAIQSLLPSLQAGAPILVADAHEAENCFFTSTLEKASIPYQLVDTQDALFAALQSAQGAGSPYRSILLDWDMPGMAGAGALMALRSAAPGTPVIVMATTSIWPDIQHDTGMTNADNFLAKPILPAALLETIAGGTLQMQAPDDPASQENGPVHHWPGKRILVVEDVAINSEIIAAVLEDTGLAIDVAENGQLGVDAFAKAPSYYDLILMDLQMPEMDGLTATRMIRAMDVPAAKTVPIIAMTANAFTEDVARCLEAGMDDHLAKPIDIDAMMQKLAYYLDEKNRKQSGS